MDCIIGIRRPRARHSVGCNQQRIPLTVSRRRTPVESYNLHVAQGDVTNIDVSRQCAINAAMTNNKCSAGVTEYCTVVVLLSPEYHLNRCTRTSNAQDPMQYLLLSSFDYCMNTRSPAVAEGPRDVGVPVEILSAVERLGYTPNESRSRLSMTADVKVHSHRRDLSELY